MPLDAERALVVFRLGSMTAALPIESVKTIALMVELARPPGLPELLEGILNWQGVGVPVVRLDRLLGLPSQPVTLYSMLVLLKDVDSPVALLVDRVIGVLNVTQKEMIPVSATDSFNACAEGTVKMRDQNVYVLSSKQILLDKERESLLAFRSIEQRRMESWGAETR